MAKDQVEASIAADPATVWAAVGDFGGVGEFLPGIDAVRLEGEDRIIAMGGMEIRERLVAKDDSARALTYSVIEGVPVTRHEATMTVSPADEGCLVTWAFEIEPDEMAPVFADVYRQGLEGLRKNLS